LLFKAGVEMPFLGRFAQLAIFSLVLEFFLEPSHAQSNRYGPLDEQARQALERYDFAKDLVHEMRVFRYEPWPGQLQRDPWAMMLFANGHLTVQAHNQAPFSRYAKSTPLASSLVGNGQLVQDTYVTQVKVAYKEVEKITYRNTWTEGAYEKRSVRFNYYVVSYWPELQRAGPFDGLVILQREPSTGDWVNLSVRVPDRGLEELIGQARIVQSGYATKFQSEIAALEASGQQKQTAAIQSRFERIGPNLVRDTQTELLWAGPMYEVVSRRDVSPWARKEQRVASEICASGKFDGQGGWALPARAELQTIVDEKTGGLADGPNGVVWGKLQDFWVPILTSEFSDGATRVAGWSQSQRRFEVGDANMRGIAFCVRARGTGTVAPSASAPSAAQPTSKPGALASTDRAGDPPAVTPSRLGPSFDCTAPTVASQPLAQIICADNELAIADLRYIIVYQALRHASNEEGRKALLAEANAFVQTTTGECSIPKTGKLNRAATATELACLKGRYSAQRELLLKQARGDALEEATLAPAEAVAIQAALKAKDLLPQGAATDGVFGPVTRAAIVQWQNSAGLPGTGFASRAMLAPSTGVGSPGTGVAQKYGDPHDYCRAVGTIDVPDNRYTGPDEPSAVLEALYTPQQIATAKSEGRKPNMYSIAWRCMDGQAWACEEDMSGAACMQVNRSRTPSPEMVRYCQASPGAGIPRAVTGTQWMLAHDWTCRGTSPVIARSHPIDPRGFAPVAWKQLTRDRGTRGSDQTQAAAPGSATGTAEPPNLRGITLGMPMGEANAVALRSCHNIQNDVKMDNGKLCDIRGDAQPANHRVLFWAPGTSGSVFSMLEQYFVPTSDAVKQCKQLLDGFEASTRGMRLVKAMGSEEKATPQWAGGREIVSVVQNFGLEGQPIPTPNSPSPGFYFKCGNYAHADIWSDQVLVQIVLSDERLRQASAAMKAAASPAVRGMPLKSSDLAPLFPGLRIEPSPKRPGWTVMRTVREPEVQIGANSFQLAVNWNGIDDPKWPFSAILQRLTSKACGAVGPGWSSTLMDRLYKTNSTTPKRQLEGTGGHTFTKRIVDTVGSCSVELSAIGARWHDLTATVTFNSRAGGEHSQPSSSRPAAAPPKEAPQASQSDSFGVCGSARYQRAAIADIFCVHSDGRLRPYAGCEKDLNSAEQGMMSSAMADRLRAELSASPPPVVRFVEACRQHDDCYGKKGTVKSACDTQFYTGMADACRRDIPHDFSEVGKKACFDNALRFNDVVRDLGCAAFKSAQQAKGVPQPVCE